MSPEDDYQMLLLIERIADLTDHALSLLARRYDVKLGTPYFAENVGDVREAIEKEYE